MLEPKRPLKVFLSYASQDKVLVRELSRRLVGEGWIDTWQDEKNLLPGQDWRVKIEEAVEEADVVIIVLSQHSVSKEGHVQKELRYAREIALEKPDDAIFLVPLRLEECEVPRGLRFYQWVDYFGEKKNGEYDSLVQSLQLRYEQKLKQEEEFARQEKSRKERKTAEKIAHEKEVAEKAHLEAEELARQRAIKDQAERETAEKVTREKEAAEKAQLEVEELARQKAVKEKAEREAAQEKAKRESAKKAKPETAKLHQKLNAPVIVAIIGGLIILAIGAGIIPQFFKPTHLLTATVSSTNTLEIVTFTPTLTETVSPTFTATPLSPTPTFPVPVTLTIVNNSTTPLTIIHAGKVSENLWPSGDWTPYEEKNSLKSGSSIDISTQFGDIWAVSDYTGAIASNIVPLYYVTEAPHQTITIASENVAVTAKNNSFGLYSLKYSTSIAAVNFVNNSSVALDLHYISSKSADQNLYTIPAGNSQRIADVQFGDFFYLSDPSGNKVLVYVATENTEQTVTISDPAVAYHLGVNQ